MTAGRLPGPGDVEQLRELAAVATPGPWTYCGFGDRCEVFARPDGPLVATTPAESDNAAFIAAANPQTVAALLDSLAAAEARADALQRALQNVAALHGKILDGEDAGFCCGCEYTWPCPTGRAIASALAAADAPQPEARVDSDSLPVPVVECPNCAASIRATMAPRPDESRSASSMRPMRNPYEARVRTGSNDGSETT